MCQHWRTPREGVAIPRWCGCRSTERSPRRPGGDLRSRAEPELTPRADLEFAHDQASESHALYPPGRGAGSYRRSGCATRSGSQIGTKNHYPGASGTGTYSVEQPHQLGMWSVSIGIQPIRRRFVGAEPHQRRLPATRPTGAGWPSAAVLVEPDGRSHGDGAPETRLIAAETSARS